MALVLSLSNLYGYFRCRFGSNANASSVIGQYVGPKMLFNVSFFLLFNLVPYVLDVILVISGFTNLFWF